MMITIPMTMLVVILSDCQLSCIILYNNSYEHSGLAAPGRLKAFQQGSDLGDSNASKARYRRLHRCALLVRPCCHGRSRLGEDVWQVLTSLVLRLSCVGYKSLQSGPGDTRISVEPSFVAAGFAAPAVSAVSPGKSLSVFLLSRATLAELHHVFEICMHDTSKARCAVTCQAQRGCNIKEHPPASSSDLLRPLCRLSKARCMNETNLQSGDLFTQTFGLQVQNSGASGRYACSQSVNVVHFSASRCRSQLRSHEQRIAWTCSSTFYSGHASGFPTCEYSSSTCSAEFHGSTGGHGIGTVDAMASEN